MEISEKILKYSTEYFPNTIAHRRHIHQYPELSFNETNTANYIRTSLNSMGYKTESLAGNTVIATLKGAKKGKTIGLRADFDALPIIETTQCEFASQNNGIMHACGHDAHAASLLTTAHILKNIENELCGDIVFIFQHAEEKLPGGAIALIEAGLFKKYPIDIMIGQHVQPGIPTNIFGFKSGKYMASTDEIYITFNGKGGHAAIKRERSDTVLATAEFIVEVQKAFSQIEIPGLPSILAFGKLKADGAVNIVPDTSIAHGTLRCFDENLRKSAKMHIKNIADTCATKYKCTADVNIIDGYPHLHNNEKSTKLAAQFTADLLGSQAVIPLDLRLTAEDFAYYSHQVPSVFYRMGITGNNKGENSLHASNFDLDEIALKTTPAVMAWLAYNFTKA